MRLFLLFLRAFCGVDIHKLIQAYSICSCTRADMYIVPLIFGNVGDMSELQVMISFDKHVKYLD